LRHDGVEPNEMSAEIDIRQLVSPGWILGSEGKGVLLKDPVELVTWCVTLFGGPSHPHVEAAIGARPECEVVSFTVSETGGFDMYAPRLGQSSLAAQTVASDPRRARRIGGHAAATLPSMRHVFA
jgi:hypothetical protein